MTLIYQNIKQLLRWKTMSNPHSLFLSNIIRMKNNFKRPKADTFFSPSSSKTKRHTHKHFPALSIVMHARLKIKVVPYRTESVTVYVLKPNRSKTIF